MGRARRDGGRRPTLDAHRNDRSADEGMGEDESNPWLRRMERDRSVRARLYSLPATGDAEDFWTPVVGLVYVAEPRRLFRQASRDQGLSGGYRRARNGLWAGRRTPQGQDPVGQLGL